MSANDHPAGEVFAWIPRLCVDGRWRWLCTLERRLHLHHFGGDFSYREKVVARGSESGQTSLTEKEPER